MPHIGRIVRVLALGRRLASISDHNIDVKILEVHVNRIEVEGNGKRKEELQISSSHQHNDLSSFPQHSGGSALVVFTIAVHNP